MEWAPSGRTVMTATTAPRLRVNNGIQVFRCGDCSICQGNPQTFHT